MKQLNYVFEFTETGDLNEKDVRVLPLDILELNKHGAAMQKVLHMFGRVSEFYIHGSIFL